jgi:hypothetical protein
MILGGESTTWRFGATVAKRDGQWEFIWSDTFGSWHGCRFDSIDGVKVMVRYQSEGAGDLEIHGGGGTVMKVPKAKIWRGSVKSEAVPLGKSRSTEE